MNVYLTTSLRDMIYIWRGDLPLARALNEGRLEVLGETWATRALPIWLAQSIYADVKSVRQRASSTGSFDLAEEKKELLLRVDTVEKVLKMDLWNWIVKQSNPSKWIFELMLLVRRSP